MQTIQSHGLSLRLDDAVIRALARAAQAVGGDEFDGALVDLLSNWIAIDSCGVMEFFVDRPPRQRLHRFDFQRRVVPQDAYLNGPYALDPLYRLYLAGAASGIYPMRDIAPDDFFTTEYYRTFYALTGVADDVNLLVRRLDGSATVLFIERGSAERSFSDTDMHALRMAWPLLQALLGQHERLAAHAPASSAETQTHAQVRQTLAHFGRSQLTERERQILMYTLSGHSAALTAHKLGVAEGTVKNHRKAIHRKLDVGSQAELFSLFIHCIPYASTEGDGDPLEVYQRRPSAASAKAMVTFGAGRAVRG